MRVRRCLMCTFQVSTSSRKPSMERAPRSRLPAARRHLAARVRYRVYRPGQGGLFLRNGMHGASVRVSSRRPRQYNALPRRISRRSHRILDRILHF